MRTIDIRDVFMQNQSNLSISKTFTTHGYVDPAQFSKAKHSHTNTILLVFTAKF